MSTEKNIERDLPIDLTPEQLAEGAQALADTTLALAEKRNDAKEAASAFRKDIKALVAKTKTLAEEQKSGRRVAAVPCMEITNWPQSITVVRLDRKPEDPDYVVETRPCEIEGGNGDAPEVDPRQSELPFGNAAPAGNDAAAEVSDDATGDEGDAATASDSEPPAELDTAAPPAEGSAPRRRRLGVAPAAAH